MADLTEDREQVPERKNELSRDAYQLAREYDQLGSESQELVRMIVKHELNRKHLP